MEDFERYGDYDERDYEEHKKSGWLGIFLKVCIFAVCASVILILGFRLVIFKSYPANMKNIYFTDALTEYYHEKNGDINAKTQKLRAPYDNPDFANFFCDNLIIIEGVGELQISVRYNESAIEAMEEKYELSGLIAGSEDLLSFRLSDNYGNVYDTVAHIEYDAKYMYHYIKLVFSGVSFEKAEWIRLEVFVNEAESDEPYAMVAIYENNENYSAFSDYNLSSKEKPNK